MFEWQGIWFPDGEKHLPEWMEQTNQYRDGQRQYQLHKYAKAVRMLPRSRRRVAVDVGAHIGQWSLNMSKDFQSVQAFEPVPAYQACWRKNVAGRSNITLNPVALGREAGVVEMVCPTPDSHGDTWVRTERVVDATQVAARGVAMRTLDSYGLTEVDFVKVDCEGYEKMVLEGGEETLRNCRPMVIVEQKPGHAQKYGLGELDAVQLLKAWGARLRASISGDYILSWGT